MEGLNVLTHEFLAVGVQGQAKCRFAKRRSALSFADIYLREGDHGGPHNHTFLPTVPGQPAQATFLPLVMAWLVSGQATACSRASGRVCGYPQRTCDAIVSASGACIGEKSPLVGCCVD